MDKTKLFLRLTEIIDEFKSIVSQLSEDEFPLMLNHFAYGKYRDKKQFYPSSVIEAFFDYKYPKRKLGSQLLREEFIRYAETINGIQVNGYYLRPHETADWIKINRIKQEMYGE